MRTMKLSLPTAPCGIEVTILKPSHVRGKRERATEIQWMAAVARLVIHAFGGHLPHVATDARRKC